MPIDRPPYSIQSAEATLLLILAMTAAIIIVVVAVVILLKILSVRNILKFEYCLLEITPPAQEDRSQHATQKLFMALYGLLDGRTWRDRLLQRKAQLTLELVSTPDKGIRYILRVKEPDKATFQQAVHAFMPDAKVRENDDYIKAVSSERAKVVEVRQAGHFAYPLGVQGFIEEHDPASYLTSSMTKLSDGEVMALQLVITTANVREADSIAKSILYNEELVHQLGSRQSSIFSKVVGTINTLLFGVVDAVSEVLHSSTMTGRSPQYFESGHKRQVAARIKHARSLSVFEQKLAGDKSLSWHPVVEDFILAGRKLEQLGFVYSKGGVIIIDPEGTI